MGDGTPLRELIFSDDIASACLFFKKQRIKFSILAQVEFSIEEYAKLIMKHLNVNLKIVYDKKKPNGTFKKLLDSSLANKHGWKHRVNFEKGISIAINDYLKNNLRKKTNLLK